MEKELKLIPRNFTMDNKNLYKCICSTEGYAPDCPQTFMQNGKMMHTLDGETQLKPRTYEGAVERYSEINVAPPKYDEGSQTADTSSLNPFQYLENQGPSPPESVDGDTIAPLRVSNRSNSMPMHGARGSSTETRFFTEQDMQFGGKLHLDRFRPLTFGDKTITDASIGGYKIDLNRTAEKASVFVALPPAVLPIVFSDKELNFNHHFFQGMEILVGRKTLDAMTASRKYSETDKGKILPLVKNLITEGLKGTDTELTIFVKRVLTATFDTVPASAVKDGMDSLIVAANIHGFQYIEQGMQCRDPELKMWLHMEHLRFRMSWFNAFKSSGIPSFALDGVQDRYESDRILKRQARKQESEGAEVEKRTSREITSYRQEIDARSSRKSGKSLLQRSFFG